MQYIEKFWGRCIASKYLAYCHGKVTIVTCALYEPCTTFVNITAFKVLWCSVHTVPMIPSVSPLLLLCFSHCIWWVWVNKFSFSDDQGVGRSNSRIKISIWIFRESSANVSNKLSDSGKEPRTPTIDEQFLNGPDCSSRSEVDGRTRAE